MGKAQKNNLTKICLIAVGIMIAVIVGSVISVYVLKGREEKFESFAPDVEIQNVLPDNITDEMLSECIIDEEKGSFSAAEFRAESHDLLGVQQNGDEALVYLQSLCEGFNDPYNMSCGRSGPCVLTFVKNGGEFKLTEYWTPRDGAGYKRSINEKFPEELWEGAMDTQSTIEERTESNKNKAKDYFEIKNSQTDVL